MRWIQRFVWMTTICVVSGCTEAPPAPPQVAPESPVVEPGGKSSGPVATPVPDGPPVKLVGRTAQFAYDEGVKYTVFAPAAAEVVSDQGEFRIHAGPHFNLRIECGHHHFPELLSDDRFTGPSKIVKQTADTLVIQKQVEDAQDPQKRVETHELFMNRTFGYRDFKISSSDKDPKLGACYFTVQDYQTMLQAAEQFALAEPLETETLKLLKQLDINFHLSPESSGENSGPSDVIFIGLPVIRTTDATMPLLEKFPNLERLSGWSLDVSDHCWEVLTKLPKLNDIDLRHANLGDAGIAYICGLPELKVLRMERQGPDEPSRRFTFKSVQRLEQLTKLEILEVNSFSITDANISQFPDLPKLQELAIRGHYLEFTGNGLRHLAKLKALKKLDLSHASITDDSLRDIGALTTLKSLNLANCHKFTGSGLSHLATLTELEELDLHYTKITEAGIEGLCALKSINSLRSIDLHEVKISPEGKAKLNAALPKCQITF